MVSHRHAHRQQPVHGKLQQRRADESLLQYLRCEQFIRVGYEPADADDDFMVVSRVGTVDQGRNEERKEQAETDTGRKL